MVKIIALILAVVIIFTAGYVVVKGIINLFAGYNFGTAFELAWYDITHLFGLIKDKVSDATEYPMANSNITWNTARSW